VTRSVPIPTSSLTGTALLLAGLAVLADAAQADVILDQVVAALPTIGKTGERTGTGAFFEGEFDAPPPIVSDVGTFPGTFQETSTAELGPARGTTMQTSTVGASVDGLVVSSTGACETEVALTGDSEQDLERDASAHGSIGVQFSVTERARFSYSGSVSISPGTPSGGRGGAKHARLALGGGPTEIGVDEQADDTVGGVTTDSASVSGVLAPGSYTAQAECTLDPAGPENTTPTRRASWQFRLTVETEDPEDVIRWVGGRAGAWGDPENWDPPLVPTFVGGDREDTALFDARGTVDVDLAAAAAASRDRARGPRGAERRVRRLVVPRGFVNLRAPASLVLFDASRTTPSIEVTGQGQLFVSEQGVSAQTIRLADSGTLVSRSPAGFLGFDTLVMESERSLFKVSEGAVVTGGTVLVADGGELAVEGPGSELRLEVPFDRFGSLALLGTSSTLRVSDGARLEAAGSGVRETTVAGGDRGDATFVAGNLTILSDSSQILPGALLSALDIEINSVVPAQLVVDGGRVEVATDLLVGVSGQGSGGALLQVGGPRRLGGELSVLGDLEIQNGIASIGEIPASAPSPSSQNLFVTGGSLRLFAGGHLRTEAMPRWVSPESGSRRSESPARRRGRSRPCGGFWGRSRWGPTRSGTSERFASPRATSTRARSGSGASGASRARDSCRCGAVPPSRGTASSTTEASSGPGSSSPAPS
jgi:hypothetical protein